MAIQGSGRFARVKKPLKSDMNVVPYIDVMLVLLVIFMVTAPMITSGLNVDLPQANGHPLESKDAPAIVSLDQQGQYYLTYQDHTRNQALSLNEITAILSDAQQQAKNNKQALNVIIEGDAQRSYGEVIALMNSLQDAGLEKVGLLTDSIQK